MIKSLLLSSFIATSFVATAQSWSPCAGTSATINVIDFCPAGTNLLACSPYTEAVMTSSDDGANFSAVATKPPAYGGYSNIVANGSNLYTIGRDTYESTDGGATWTKKGNLGISVTPNDAVYYHGAIFVASSLGVRRSTDGGNTYSMVSTGLTNNTVYDILVHSDALYITTAATGVYKSTDDGVTWTSIKSDLPTASGSNRISALGGNLYYAEYSSGLYISTNDGGNWTKLTTAPSVSIASLLPVGDKIVVGCAGGKVFYTADNGTTFTNIDLPSSSAVCQRLFFANNYLYAGTNSAGAYRALTTWGGTSSVGTAAASTSVQVFPNPADGIFYVEMAQPSTVEVTDMLGRVVYRNTSAAKSVVVDLGLQPAGAYLLSVRDGVSVTTSKLVKN